MLDHRPLPAAEHVLRDEGSGQTGPRERDVVPSNVRRNGSDRDRVGRAQANALARAAWIQELDMSKLPTDAEQKVFGAECLAVADVLEPCVCRHESFTSTHWYTSRMFPQIPS